MKASSHTRDEAFQRAQDFAYVAKKNDFEKEAAALGLKILETPDFQNGAMIPGIGTFESLNKFAFKNAKSFFKKDVGEISDAYQINKGYVVVKVVDEKKEGIRPFDEVKESLRPRALREKKMAKLKNLVQQKYSF